MLQENRNIKLITTVIICGLYINLITGQNLKKCDFVSKKVAFMEVQCNGRTSFPLASTLPENTASISLKDNKIQQLPNQPSQVHRNKVLKIDLSGNIIEQLLEDRLGNTFPNVSNLDLSDNKIRFLSKNSFQHLKSLSILNLSYNKLASVRQGWFSHLLELRFLDLRHNTISVVMETKRGWPNQLKELNLSFNKLRTIPPLPTRASVNLVNNPIFCGCDLDVNQKVSETTVKVQCHKLRYFRHPVQIQTGLAKYKRYKAGVNTCQPTEIINFSYLVAKEQIVITCITSDGHPDSVIFIYHGSKVIKISKEHVSMNVKEPGLYSCKVTNYISSDQKDLVISFFSTSAWSDSDVSWKTELQENDKTKNTKKRVFTRTETKHEDETVLNNQGTCMLSHMNFSYCFYW